jgi:chromosome segregation ATPase
MAKKPPFKGSAKTPNKNNATSETSQASPHASSSPLSSGPTLQQTLAGVAAGSAGSNAPRANTNASAAAPQKPVSFSDGQARAQNNSQNSGQNSGQNNGPNSAQNNGPRVSENARRVLGGEVIEPPRLKNETASNWPFWLGVVLTALWFVTVFLVTGDALATGKILGMPFTGVALGIAGVMAPAAFLWMIIAYLQRASDVKAITEPLRRQLQMVLGTGFHAESRVRRFNEALERQLELMRQAGDGSYDVLHNAIQILQEEERAIGSLAERSGKEIQRVAVLVRDNSEVLEDLLHDNRERFNDLSGRIAGHIATLDERTDAAANRLGDMIGRLHGFIDEFKQTADKKLLQCNDIAGQIHRQEKDSEEASRRMVEMLQGARLGVGELSQLLQKNEDILDNSGKKLALRMQDISQQLETFAKSSQQKEDKLAERSQTLTDTLAREIATLEALTHRLESQMVAANEGLGLRTQELDAKQQELAKQAGGLMQGLTHTIKHLDETTNTAFEKFAGLRDDVAAQTTRATEQFNASNYQYEAMADKLENISRNVADRVAVLGSSLALQVQSIATGGERAVAAGETANSTVGKALNQLEVMIGRIFDAEKCVTDGAGNIVRSFSESFNSFTGAADQHLARLNAAHDHFEDVNQTLVLRAREAEGTWQSLVSAAETQQNALQNQLRGKIEEAVGLLNETAVAIESSRDSLYAHVEAGLSRSREMADELARVGEMTEAPFNDAVTRVRMAVEQGEQHLTHFASTLQKNADTVVELGQRLATHSDAAGHKAAEALAGLDAVAARMEAIQHESMQSGQDMVLRLSHMASQVQNRMGEITHTAESEQRNLAEVVRQLSLDINGLIYDSQVADQRVRLAAALLSQQAADVRTQLEVQAESIDHSLTHLQSRFSDTTTAMQTTTHAAQVQIDEITQRYTALANMDHGALEQRVTGFNALLQGTEETLGRFGSAMDERTQQIHNVQQQIEINKGALDNATQTALDRLSVFTHALSAARSSSTETAQEVFARLNDMQEQFNRQIGAVNEGSQTVTRSMRQAVAELVEQSVGLAAASSQAEERIGTLSAATNALQNQAGQVRNVIEDHANSMQARMNEVASRIESSTVSLERNAIIAFDRSEGMAKRFEQLGQAAFGTLAQSAGEIEKVADISIAKVVDVNKALGDQVERLNIARANMVETDEELRKSATSTSTQLNQLARETGATAVYAADQLRVQLAGLRGEAEGMLQRFEGLGQGLAHQSLGILDVVSSLEDKVGALRETTAAVYEDAHRTGQQIVSNTLEFRNEVTAAVQNMAATGEAMQQRGDFTINMVHQMAQRFTEATQNLRDQFESEATRLENVTNTAQSQLEAVAQRLQKGAGELEAVTGKMGNSGQQVGETLEKANFLLRNVNAQIDRMKTSSQEVSSQLANRMAEMLATFERELRGITSHTDMGLDEIHLKARGISTRMHEDAQVAAENIVSVLKDMREEVNRQFAQVGGAVKEGMSEALVESGEAAAALQLEFRKNIVLMAEALVTHLRQVQEKGTGIVESIQSGASVSAESAMQMLNQLRRSTEEEVHGMSVVVEKSLSQMQGAASRMREDMKEGRTEVAAAAAQAFNMLRERVEGEVRGILTRAEAAVQGLQTNCGNMTREMEGALLQAESTGRNFNKMADALRGDANKIATSVGEAGQNLAATHSLLQRSQNTLFEVAQKSNDALTIFNDSLTQQTKNLTALQQNVTQAATQLGETDGRLHALKDGFQNVLAELMQRLNDGMLTLGQQVLSVRNDSQNTAREVTRSAQEVAEQNEAIRQTAQQLAQALVQLEGVNRNLGQGLRETAQETVGHMREMENFGRQVESQIGSLESALENITQQSRLATHALDVPLDRAERLNERLDKTLNLTALMADRVPGYTMPAETRRPTASYAPPPPAAPPAAPRESVEDTLRRLRERGALPPQAAYATSAPQAAPQARQPAPQPAPQPAFAERAPAYAPPPPVAAPAPQPQAAAAPAPAKNRSDNDLINSLTQIIQQLEETAGGAADKQKKAG